MTNPIVGGISQKSFSTGLEDFDVPFDFGDQTSGTQSQTEAPSAPSFDPGEAASSGGGMDTARMQLMMQMQKVRDDFARTAKQAKFFLPRTLEQIGSQYGTQGSYWSSGRRDAQHDAAKKTRFDMQQAKSDAEFQLKSLWLQMAEMGQAEQGARSA